MEITKRLYADRVVDIQCDKCGGLTLVGGMNLVYATLVFEGCYGAEHDFERHTAHFCEKCAFEIFDSLEGHAIQRKMF